MSTSPVINLHDLHFSWPGQSECFSMVDFELAAGETVFLYGPSGCGKSTSLNLLAGVLSAQRGDLHLLGQLMNSLSSHQRDRFRADHIGLIFQQFNLLPYLSVMDNVLLPLTFSPLRLKRLTASNVTAKEKAIELLNHL